MTVVLTKKLNSLFPICQKIRKKSLMQGGNIETYLNKTSTLPHDFLFDKNIFFLCPKIISLSHNKEFEKDRKFSLFHLRL